MLTILYLVGFYTRSLALVADAFHYVQSCLCCWDFSFANPSSAERLDWIYSCVCCSEGKKYVLQSSWLVPDEKQISAKKDSPQDLSFGWQRSRLLGAFFNGVFLLALGVSIFLQSIERFVSVQGVWCIRRQHVMLLIKSQSWNSQNLCSSLVASVWLSILSAPHSCMV